MRPKKNSVPMRRLTRAQLIARLERELEGVKRMRIARMLAREFIGYYGIFPYGVDLIRWLTRSHCRTNTEALVCWMETQMEDPEFMAVAAESEICVVLAKRMERLLASVEASCPW